MSDPASDRVRTGRRLLTVETRDPGAGPAGEFEGRQQALVVQALLLDRMASVADDSVVQSIGLGDVGANSGDSALQRLKVDGFGVAAASPHHLQGMLHGQSESVV